MLLRTGFLLISVALSHAVADLELSEETLNSTGDIGPAIQGTLVNISDVLLQRQATITGVCDGVKQLVCDTCSTFRVCLGTEPSQGATVTCPTDQPYCNYGTTTDYCSTVPIPNVCADATQNTPVTCSAVGTFPGKCPAGYVYNAALELCALENLFSRCITMQCTANFIGHLRYGQSQRFYGLCDGTGVAPIVYRCPNRANFAFIAGTTFGECGYLCPGQGNYPNSNNPAAYFQCFLANRQLRYNLVLCPTGLTFNSRLRYCTVADENWKYFKESKIDRDTDLDKMFQFRAKLILCYLICYGLCLIGNSSPVLVLVANGSDITINFPGENNNNRVFSIVSSSGNNNPSMLDWIGGNGANKAPTITLGKSNAPAMNPDLTDDNSGEDSADTLSKAYPTWGSVGSNAYDHTDGILPLVTTVTPKIPVNITTTSSSAFVETADKVIAAPV
uniref:Chitin-binding type-2 domain-containing protein n=1 Tax=Anopheles minimus TaxID=112268 RepID=A0A182W884_9DIPT